MRHTRRLSTPTLAALLLALGLLPLAGCAPAPEPVPQADLERAQATLQPFKQRLLDALVAALDEGPANAIRVCRTEAPKIAAELSVDGVRMGRTSHRLRNPANAPEPWVEPLLAAYLEDPLDAEPRAVRVDDATLGYVEPIYVVHFCLSCHGPDVDAALLETIRSQYPDDQATGFKNGDLRGLFWVTLPLGAAPDPADTAVAVSEP